MAGVAQRDAFRERHVLLKRGGKNGEANLKQHYKICLFEGFDKYAPTSASGEPILAWKPRIPGRTDINPDCTESASGERNQFKRVKGSYYEFLNRVKDNRQARETAKQRYENALAAWNATFAEYERRKQEYDRLKEESRLTARPMGRITEPSKPKSQPKLEESHLRPLNFLDMPIAGDILNMWALHSFRFS